MGDSFHVLFRLGFVAGRSARPEAAPLSGVAVDEAELEIGEADEPVTGRGLGDADGLAGERLADEDAVTAPADVAAGPHAALGAVGRIGGRFDPLGVASWRGRIVSRRRDLAQGLVRPHIVVIVPPGVEARLLGGAVRGGRAGGLALQRFVHALVPPVLLRLAGIDAVETDAELDPAD